MRMVRNAWTPDTCPRPGCKVEYEWDDDDPAGFDNRRVVNIMRRCPAHATEAAGTIYSICQDENRRKNLSLARLFALDPTLFLPDNVPDPAKLRWSFDGSRTLVLELPQASGNTKSTYSSDLQAQFGATKVQVK